MVLVARRNDWRRRLAFVAALYLVVPAATRWTLKFPMPSLPLNIFVELILDPFLIALAFYYSKTLGLGRVHSAPLTCIAKLLHLQVSSA